MALSGRIEEDRPDAILGLVLELHGTGATGTLKLQGRGAQKAVYFREGHILFASSNVHREQIPAILVELGKLRQEQLDLVRARVAAGRSLMRVLLEPGYVSAEELAEVARIKIERVLSGAFAWREGAYQFVADSLPENAPDLGISTRRLLFASMAAVDDPEWGLRQMGSLDHIPTPPPGLAALREEVPLDDRSRRILSLADGRKTVRDIAAALSVDALKVAKVLGAAWLTSGVEDRERRESADAPTSSPAEPERTTAVPTTGEPGASGRPREGAEEGSVPQPTDQKEWVFLEPPPAAVRRPRTVVAGAGPLRTVRGASPARASRGSLARWGIVALALVLAAAGAALYLSETGNSETATALPSSAPADDSPTTTTAAVAEPEGEQEAEEMPSEEVTRVAPVASNRLSEGRELLARGEVSAAAQAFRDHLRGRGDGFTVAIGLYCDGDNLRRILERAGDARELLVLPADVGGRECRRIVWGSFDSEPAALRAIGEIPARLRGPDAVAIPVASVIE